MVNTCSTWPIQIKSYKHFELSEDVFFNHVLLSWVFSIFIIHPIQHGGGVGEQTQEHIWVYTRAQRHNDLWPQGMKDARKRHWTELKTTFKTIRQEHASTTSVFDINQYYLAGLNARIMYYFTCAPLLYSSYVQMGKLRYCYPVFIWLINIASFKCFPLVFIICHTDNGNVWESDCKRMKLFPFKLKARFLCTTRNELVINAVSSSKERQGSFFFQDTPPRL